MARVSRRPGCPTPDKDRYRDRAHAEVGLLEVMTKFGDPGSLHPYECACTRWHLGRSATGYTWWWRRFGSKDARFGA